MSQDENASPTDEPLVPTTRETIREALLALAEERRREVVDFEEDRKRSHREKQAKVRREVREKRSRSRKAAMLRSVNESNERVRNHLSDASRSLAAALRSATEHKFPRHSEEGRQQDRTIRALENALGAVRRVGAGRYDEDNFEVDLDLD